MQWKNACTPIWRVFLTHNSEKCGVEVAIDSSLSKCVDPSASTTRLWQQSPASTKRQRAGEVGSLAKGFTLTTELAEIEREFREQWRGYHPGAFQTYLDRSAPDEHDELLTRLLSAELEFAYLPPKNTASDAPHEQPAASASSAGESTEAAGIGDDDEDEERIRPSLNIFLAHYPTLTKRKDLIIRLAVLEYALRLRYDPTPPKPESYLSFCRDADETCQEHLVRLLQQTEEKIPVGRFDDDEFRVERKSDDSTVRDEGDSTGRISLEPLPNNLGWFLLIDLISRGGMGFVYSAIDLRSAAPVAVKVMRRDDSWSIYRFIEEFSWLSQVNHPNLVKLYDACAEGDLRYFSMEMVQGRTIDEWFRQSIRSRPDPWSPLRKVLAQTASALQFLHHNGAIHCDIKCSNLMITSKRRAVLLDMGLASREGGAGAGLGTLQYTAPEVLLTEKHTRASDWFSFGLMIYEIVTGTFEPKFKNHDGTSSLRLRQDLKTGGRSTGNLEIDVDDLRRQMEHCDSDLVDLCCDLLDPNPDERPQGNDVVERLGGTLFLNLGASKYLGREEVQVQLSDFVKQTQEESLSRFVLLRGESGIGKTSTLKTWIENFDKANHYLLRVRCYHQDKTPLRLLNALVQELVLELSAHPTFLWRESLETHIEGISQVFPQVRQLVDSGMDFKESIRTAKSQSEEARFTRELMKWLVELSQLKPFLIIVDDAQWADEKSLAWLVELVGRQDIAVTVIVVDENDQSALERQIAKATRLTTDKPAGASSDRENQVLIESLTISPLSEETSRELIRHWQGIAALEIGDAVYDDLIERSQGSPLLLRELFQTYAHYRLRDSITDEEWLNNYSKPSLRSRFSLLPVDAEIILQFLAVAGQPLSFHQLQMVSRILPKDLQHHLNLLESQGWITSRLDSVESAIEIAHDRFRRAVLSTVPEDRLQRRHARMARMLSSSVPPPWSRMGLHFWKAGQFTEAAACYAQAARNAKETGSFLEAIQFLDRAKHKDADRKPREVRDVKRLEADCLAGLGNSIKAAQFYEELMDSSEDSKERLLLQCLAGEQWIRGGQLEPGLKALQAVLSKLGLSGLNKSQSVVSKFMLQLGFNAKMPISAPVSPTKSNRAFDPLYRSLNRVTVPLTFLDNELGPNLVLLLKRHAEKEGAELDRAISLMHFASLLTLGKRRFQRLGLQWLRLGRQYAKKAGIVEPVMGTYNFALLLSSMQRGRVQQAQTFANRSIRWYARESLNRQWELQFVGWGQLTCFWETMRLQQLRTSTLEHRESAEQRSDPIGRYFAHVSAGHYSDLVVDDVEGARSALRLAEGAISSQSFQSPRFFLWLSRIKQELYEGNYEKAYETLDRDWNQLDKAYVFRTKHYRWLALCVQLCCCLVMLREGLGKKSEILRRARNGLTQFRKLEYRPFTMYADAFEISLSAIEGQPLSLSRIQLTVDEFEHFGHTLYANALRWHLGCHESTRDALQEAQDRFAAECCVRPDRLMEILIPLSRNGD